MKRTLSITLFCVLPAFALFHFQHSIYAEAQTSGTLRIHPTNPLFFMNGSGKAVYLSGHQIFVDLQDNTFDKQYTYNRQSTLDWSWYLQFVKDRNLNYIRNWTLLSTGIGSLSKPIAYPMPYKRVSGYGNANDGCLKFDLNRFDQTFFDQLRSRIIDAGKDGIYVSIMLFEVYSFGPGGDAMWQGNVFNGANNINGIDVDTNNDGWGAEFYYSPDQQVRDMQRAYVEKVIDTVNDMDNVIYEVVNELADPNWQYWIIDMIKNYEASKPKQHLILMSPGGVLENGNWHSMSKDAVVNSNADVVAMLNDWGDFVTDPPENNLGKPSIMDMDHIRPGNNDPSLPWKALTRGYHFSLYDHPFESPESESPLWELVRTNIGAAVRYANSFRNLSQMQPCNNLASAQFCLADFGSEYLVYQPDSGSFTVDLQAGTYDYEWFNPSSGSVATRGTMMASEGNNSLTPPFSGSAVLYLKSKVQDTPEADLIQNLSGNPGMSLASPTAGSRQIVISGSNIFVVWDDDTPGNREILFRRSADSGVTWDPPLSQPALNLSNNKARSSDPTLAVNGNMVFVVWVDGADTYSLAYRRSTDGGMSFEPIQILQSRAIAGGFPQLAVSGSHVHIVWTKTIDPHRSGVYYQRSTNTRVTFTSVVLLSAFEQPFCDSNGDPRLSVDGANVAVVWQGGQCGPTAILFRGSIDGGATFSPLTNLSAPLPPAHLDPKVSTNGSNIHVVWLAENLGEVLYRGSANGGKTFGPIQVLANTEVSYRLVLTLAAANHNVYAAWADLIPGDKIHLFLVRSTDGGTSFEAPQKLSTTEGGTYPQIVAHGSSLYLAWQGESPLLDISLRSSTDSGATWDPPLDQPPIKLLESTGNSLIPQLAVDDSNIYIMWPDSMWTDGTTSNYDVFFRRIVATP